MKADFWKVSLMENGDGKWGRPWYPSIDMGLIKLGPGEKWVGETDLARFIEVAKVGEYEVGVKINVKYYLKDEDERTQPTRTMSGQRTIRLVVIGGPSAGLIAALRRAEITQRRPSTLPSAWREQAR